MPGVRRPRRSAGDQDAAADDDVRAPDHAGAQLRGLSRLRDGPFPLDEELGLAPGHLTPYVRASVIRLATWMSFVRAGRDVAHFNRGASGRDDGAADDRASGGGLRHGADGVAARIARELPLPPDGPVVQYLSGPFQY